MHFWELLVPEDAVVCVGSCQLEEIFVARELCFALERLELGLVACFLTCVMQS